MAMYEKLASIDVIGPAAEFMDAHGFGLVENGKIAPMNPWHHKIQTPWINAVAAPDRDCGRWLGVYFPVYGFIPRHCYHCFKIVVKPNTLDDLFKLHELQVKMGLPAKCGVERRPHGTHRGVYMGFWYCPRNEGLEGARKLHRTISLRVKDKLGIQTSVILKRACTEFEDSHGPSENWEYPEKLHLFEDLLDATWVMPYPPREERVEPTVLQVYIKRVWIDHGIRNRDLSAKDYIDSMRSFGITDTTFYHDNKVEIKTPPAFKAINMGGGSGAESVISGLSSD
uniref:Uncharacterized protein n=1 Tax=viral metagenome TaxID=1070528 RepID=A0A6M3L805_9ZZZZ